MAILHAYGFKKLKIPALSPTFFANVAKMCSIDVEFTDIDLDMSSKEADVVSNFYESFEPKNRVVFQSWGEPLGEAEVWVMKYGGCVRILVKEDALAKKIELFLEGGVKRGRLWNYDVISFGIKNRVDSCTGASKEEIEKSNEVTELFEKHFHRSIYTDFLKSGKKTLKEGFVLLLKPSLYCPKEDIYTELKKRGVDVQVRFKPLYKTTLFSGPPLPVSEEFYKAQLILPLKKDILPVVDEVLAKYRHRGCSF